MLQMKIVAACNYLRIILCIKYRVAMNSLRGKTERSRSQGLGCPTLLENISNSMHAGYSAIKKNEDELYTTFR